MFFVSVDGTDLEQKLVFIQAFIHAWGNLCFFDIRNTGASYLPII